MSGTQGELRFVGTTLGVESELDVRVLGGPLSVRLAPKTGIDLTKVWDAVSSELQRLVGFGLPSLNGPWAKVLLGLSDDKKPLIVTPTLWIAPSGATKKYAVTLQLEFNQILTIGGSWNAGPFTIEMEPTYRIAGLIFGYDSAAGGLSIKAKVVNKTTPVPSDGRGLLTDGSPSGEKSQVLSFPFPVPAQQPAAGQLFTFHYIGIGQHVGPNPNTTSDDPMLAIFEVLESQLTGDDPAGILTTLAQNFYHPDRGWFLGLDVELRGFRIMVLFNDPALYGLRISVGWDPPTPFSGFLFEILYQKLSPNLGLYYGALTLPYFLRRIVLEGVILILPGFAIWIYTNGDFRVNVGWPLGNASIAVQVGPLVGAAGFYFAKLRSADNPAVQPTVDYNPILAFGIGVTVYIKEGFNSSIFSAQIDLSVTATLQGLLAWKAESGGNIARVPDHYWFAGTASLSVLIQGTVDFAIIKASVVISFQAYAGLALETGYGTLVHVSAAVSVSVSVKVIFFTIRLSFSASVETQFVITGGTPASVNGPLDPDLSGFVQPSLEALVREELAARAESLIARLSPKAPGLSTRLQAATRAAQPPQVIEVMFALQPTAVYQSGGAGTFAVVASLFIETPVPGAPATPRTPFETLIVAMVDWLLSLTPPGPKLSDRFAAIVDMLGSGSEPPLGDWVRWRMLLDAFLGTLTFSIGEIDATSSENLDAAPLPMLDVLQLTYEDENGITRTIDFDTFNPVPAGYPSLVNEYYAHVGSVGGNVPSHADRVALATTLRQSFAAYVLADYFLMQARNAAGALLQQARAYENQQLNALVDEAVHLWGEPERVWDLFDRVTAHVATITGQDELDVILGEFDYASAAGLGSRYLLNGLQLPLPESPVDTAPLHVLTGQQYGVRSGATSVSGTLSVSPTADIPQGSIVFPSGTPGSAACTLPLPGSVPPMPAPEWHGAVGSPAVPTNGAITVTPIPGVNSGPLYFATKNQIGWNAAGAGRTILPLPQPLQGRIAAEAKGPGLRLSVSPSAPPTSNTPASTSPPAPPIPSIPALLIRLSISQVPSNAAANVVAQGSPQPGSPIGSPTAGVPAGFLPHVYAVSGADEATRDLIFAALQSDLSDAVISLLYTTTDPSSPVASPAGPTGLQSDVLADTTLIAKTNLSTLNQIPATSAVMAERYAIAVHLGDDAASIADVRGFLRLLWEVSVVNAPGFFLFYNTATGEDLPADLFAQPGTPGGNAAEFDILVQFSGSPASVVPLTAATNCVLLDEPGPAAAVYLEVLHTDGTPALQYAPAYAAGNVAFSLLWNRPPETDVPVPVDDLYTLIQYKVAGGGGYRSSVWSLPVGPSENNGPQAALVSPSAWTFVAAVAVNEFYGSPEANRYSVIDQPVDLGFRLVDLYGDALPGSVEARFLPLYQDPLLTIAQWPGVLWSWRVVPSTRQSASAVLKVTFDPDTVVPPQTPEAGGTSVRQQWQGILARYGLILDQLTDPNTTVTLTSTLVPGLLDVAIAERLAALAAGIAANIAAGLNASPPAVDGVIEEIEVPIPFVSVAALTEDIVPVNFVVASERDPSLIDPVALAGLPAARGVSYSIPPDVTTTASPSSSPASRFALDFEAAFTGFDGRNGVLKLAQRAGVQNGQDAPKVEAYWAVRWSETAGIGVEFDPAPIFFARAPLSTKPLAGHFGGGTWTNVNVDDWARRFAEAYDRFLSPDMAVAIAILDVMDGTGEYDTIVRTKQSLASTIVKGVEPLIDGQPAGDLAAARARLEQALLSTLGSAFTVSTIVQVSANVTLNGQPSPISSPARAPRLYGAVGPMASSTPVASRQYTLTPGELPLLPGASVLTTLLTVTNPSADAAISLPLDYQVSYLQHDFEVGDAYLDYVPSSWLKFTIPTDAPLQMQIAADATLPVPLIVLPQAPSLVGQQAVASPTGSGGSPGDIAREIADALRWTYEATITPNWSAQDTLYFDVTYNKTPTELRLAQTRDVAVAALADALATFLQWYDTHAGSFGTIVREAFPSSTGTSPGSPGEARALIRDFVRLSADVERKWAALYLPLVGAVGTPEVLADSFRIEVDLESARNILFGRTDASPGNPLYWPTINGEVYHAADAEATGDGWWQQPRSFPRGTVLDIAVPDLAIADRQSALLSTWIVRNADLIPHRVTNPAFVYTTDVAAFSTSVVPLIHRASLAPLQPAASLTATLIDILLPIAQAGAGLATSLRVGVTYSFAMSRVGSQILRSGQAVLLANGLSLGQGSDVPRIAANLARGIGEWYQAATRSSDGALLNVALTLFGELGTQELPLVQIDAIPIDVSNVGTPAVDWWTT